MFTLLTGDTGMAGLQTHAEQTTGSGPNLQEAAGPGAHLEVVWPEHQTEWEPLSPLLCPELESALLWYFRPSHIVDSVFFKKLVFR